jgi:hypothetical protein
MAHVERQAVCSVVLAMLLTRIRVAAVLALISLFPVAASAATITFYTSEAAFVAAANPSLLETFEAVAPKDTALAVIVSNGVTYSPTGIGTNVWVASPGYPNFGAGVGVTTTSILTATGEEDFVGAFFSTPYMAVGFDAYLNGLGPATATFFNGATVLGSFSFPALQDNIAFLGIVSDTPITSFRWTGTLGGQLNTGIDNIQVSQVPEPSTLLLVGVGLVAYRYRRRLRA